jgi:hypothetical protein
MLGKTLVMSNVLAMAVSMAMAADTPSPRPTLSADEIVARNVQARGGLKAWRAVQSISWSGKMGAGGNQRAPLPVQVPGKGSNKFTVPPRPKEEAQLPFQMDMQRVRKVRLELQFNGQTAIQVYDGTNGWKVRPYLNRHDVEPFTEDELKTASEQPDLDGLLIDYAAKGEKIDIEGMEKVEDHDTYKLKVTLKDGREVHAWIDAKTFLEAKIEGTPRRLDGKMHPVEIYYRDFRAVHGLQVPFVLETRVLPLSAPGKAVREAHAPPEQIVIEKVEVNPKFDASRFSKPAVETAVVTAPH